MTDITKDQFWNMLNEPEPVIKSNSDGSKIYMWYNEQGKRHRENDLPGVIWYRDNGFIFRKEWCQHGMMHRIDGPAVICYDEDGKISKQCWYLNGEECTEEKYWEKLKEMGYE